MKTTEIFAHEMFVRVDGFGETHANSFPEGSRGRALFLDLKAVIVELNGHAEAQVAQRSAAAQGTADRDEARKALRAIVEAIHRTARAMAFTMSGLEKRFRLPHGNNDQALLITARSFLTEATPLKAEFVRNEIPSDFLEQLAAQIESFEQSIAAQNRSRGARVTATSAIKNATNRGLAILKQLDAIVRNKFAGDPATIAAWNSASRTERAARTTKAKSQANNAPAPQ